MNVASWESGRRENDAAWLQLLLLQWWSRILSNCGKHCQVWKMSQGSGLGGWVGNSVDITCMCFTFHISHLIASIKDMHLPLLFSNSGETYLCMQPKGYTLEVHCLNGSPVNQCWRGGVWIVYLEVVFCCAQQNQQQNRIVFSFFFWTETNDHFNSLLVPCTLLSRCAQLLR